MPTLSITLQFIQQQLDNTSFGYTIIKNGSPLVYPDTLTNFINKTFNSEVIENVGRIVSLDSVNNYNYVSDFVTGFNGNVFDISKQSSGKYIVSGSFTQYNGDEALGICRLNTDFSLDTSFTPPNLDWFPTGSTIPYFKIVKHRLLSDDKIIVFGTGVKCGTSYFIGKLNVNGTIDTDFKSNTGFWNGTPPITSYLNDIVIDDNDNIICVGEFTNYSYFSGITPVNLTANRIIRLSSNGTYDSSFVIGAGCTNPPLKVAYNPLSDTIVIAGSGTYKGDGIGGIMEISNVGTRTGKYFTLSGTGGDIVTAMHIDASGVLTISGYFNSYNGSAVPNLIRILNNSNRDTTLPNGTTLNIPASVITRDATYTYLGGDFTVYSGQSIVKFLKITSTGSVPLTNQYDFNQKVNAIFLDGANNTLVGGNFTIYANTILPNNNTNVPIGVNSLTTQSLTWTNLEDFNSHPDITYTQIANNIVVQYTFLETDVVVVSNVTDIPEYLEIIVDGNNIPPVITLTNYPQTFTPVYNPVTFKFNSTFYIKYGFRYLFNVYNTKDETLIGKYKLSPQVDGTGYIDISKVLSNLTSVDFNPNLNFNTNLVTYDASKSYVDYRVEIGAEFAQDWLFNSISSNSEIGSLYPGYIVLSNEVLIANTYVVGDQITINSSLTSNSLNGLHQVVEIIDSYNLVIDLLFAAGTDTTTTGVTTYADNRKISFTQSVVLDNLIAFNGARPWNDFINWNEADYTMNSADFPAKFLTDIPTTGFNITPTQDIYLNIHFDTTASIYPIIVAVETNNNITSFIDEISLSEIDGSIQQVAVGFNQISEIFSDCYPSPPDCIEYYDVYLLVDGDPELRVSEKIRFNIDRRCKIEEYEILFMDRMGSLASYAFQLRASERGTIKRDMIKQQVDYNLSNDTYLNSYDISERGSYITNVNVVKTLELNTNWMTDEMSVYFEQLLTSPYTWIKIDSKYYACTINDNDFEVTRQKNKNLIRKTITVTMANNNTINI